MTAEVKLVNPEGIKKYFYKLYLLEVPVTPGLPCAAREDFYHIKDRRFGIYTGVGVQTSLYDHPDFKISSSADHKLFLIVIAELGNAVVITLPENRENYNLEFELYEGRYPALKLNGSPLAVFGDQEFLHSLACTDLPESVTTLVFHHCKDITALENPGKFIHLRNLSLINCRELKDICPLWALRNLTGLDLINCSPEDIYPVSALRKLTSLNIRNIKGCIISDISPVKLLSNLTHLGLTGLRKFCDLAPLSNLTNLISLDFGDNGDLTEIEPLAELKKLRALNLAECYNIESIYPLTGLSHLKVLNLFNVYNINRMMS